MFCPNCGAQNQDDAAFCTSCGSSLTASTPQNQPVYAQPSQPVQYSTLPPVRRIGFGEAIKNFFRNYANFKGRATRSEYWFSYLFVTLVNFVFSILLGVVLGVFTGLGTMTEDTMNTLSSVLSYIPTLAFFIPSLSIIWRRLHDIGRSGAFYFLSLIPLVGAIILIVWFCKASDADNEYGPRKI